MILVDFDNTLVYNQNDVDLGNPLSTFLATWKSLKTIPVNNDLIFWLRERPECWSIFTNRSCETLNKIKEHLDELGLKPKNIYCCEGKKLEIINHMKSLGIDYFLIDNSAKYKPHLLVSPALRLPIINYTYLKWVEGGLE